MDGTVKLYPDHSTDLVAAALALCAAGVSCIPVNHLDKKPLWKCLPKGEDGDATWNPYRKQIADEPTVRSWFRAGAKAIAIVCGTGSGGVLVFDFDVDGFYEAWCAAVGNLANELPVQRTGGGGYQVFCRCENHGENTKLAWVEDETEDSGRKCAIETRAEGGYAVVPTSLHPSGGRYQMLSGDLTQIPTISGAHADALLAAARKLDECSLTRQEKDRIEREAHLAHQQRSKASRNGSGSVIDAFNAAHAIEALLERYGYTRSGERFIRPGGKSTSVSVKAGRSCHFSSNDPLNDSRVKSGIGIHDAFDVYCFYAYGNDVSEAVRAAAEAMGLRQNPSKNTPRADKTSAGDVQQGVLSVSALRGALNVEPFKPFPTAALPYPVAQFIRESAVAIGCDDSFIALPLLAGLASAIGTSRRIRLKWDWLEFPIIWSVIVASSGQRKSPGFSAALKPLQDMQRELMNQHKAEAVEYRLAQAKYKQDLKQKAAEPPQEPERPILKRLVVSDVTIEALAMLLEENPRGLLVARDEMSGWLSSFNQYKSGRGSDASGWLELHRGGLLTVDRKTSERRTIYIPRAAASLTGTIQPGVIKRGYGKESFENGMVARTLFAMPPARQRTWTDGNVNPHTADRMREIYAKLAALEFDARGEPIDLPLSSGAQAIFTRFVDELGAEQFTLGDARLEAAWSKLEGYAPRLALIIHLVRAAINDPDLGDPDRIDEQSITAGITLVHWFGHEARRVYADMGISDEDRDRVRLIEIINRHGGSITTRDLARGCRRYAPPGAAESALDELVSVKLGAWDFDRSGPSGGRPKTKFVLTPLRADTDETPDGESPQGVLSPEAPENEHSSA